MSLNKGESMDIKLVVFDVDGTLVTAHSRILLDSTIESIHRLQDRGIQIAIASGRPFYAMERSIIERVKFDYIIASNGSFVYNNNRKRIINAFQIPNDLVMRYALYCETTKSGALFNFEDAGYAYAGFDKIVGMMSDTLGRIDFVVNHRSQIRHLQSKPNAIIGYIEDAHIGLFRSKFPEFEFLSFIPNFYDVFPKGTNKATGISDICQDIGIDMSQVMAFGDAMNDYEMIQGVGLGVAMGNALPAILEVADYVTDNTEQEGIKNALVRFNLIEDFENV